MSFIESPRFPDAISYNATGGPTWKTSLTELDSGYEYANQNWSLARMRFEVGHDARTEVQFKELLAFYVTMKGRANAFRFKDWSDYTATDSEGVFSPIDSTHFQMFKLYTSGPDDTTGPNEYYRKINKPIATVTVTGGVTPVVDYETGIVAVASGTPSAWKGEFDVPVRFDTDLMQATILTRSGGKLMYGWSSIVLIEVRI